MLGIRLAPHHAAVHEFYRAHGEPARVGTRDQVFALFSERDEIHGAVRLAPRRDSAIGHLHFMRSLYVAPPLRRQGWGSRLVSHALHNAAGPCFCYAYSHLEAFYTSAGFEIADPSRVPGWMADGYTTVQRQQTRKGRCLLLLTHRVSAPLEPRLHIVLIQHAREQSRPTATAPLLNHASVKPHLQVEHWIWSGRKDAAAIGRRIAKLPRQPRLLWTDGGSPSAAAHLATPDSPHGPTTGVSHDAIYIVLDGTWQEARSIYRKTPALYSLPRFTLDSATSSYVLRGDFGWRDRFSGDGATGRELLCTAEVGAALLELAGEVAAASRLRTLLCEYQDAYVTSHPHLHHVRQPQQDLER